MQEQWDGCWSPDPSKDGLSALATTGDGAGTGIIKNHFAI